MISRSGIHKVFSFNKRLKNSDNLLIFFSYAHKLIIYLTIKNKTN